MNPVGTGALFENQAHRVFMEITGSRYDGMAVRFKKKKLPPLLFSKDDLRGRVLYLLGGREDGFMVCRYCRSAFGLKDLALDHAIPLSRGGGMGLSNIEMPCQNCNQAKGSMTPEEFLKLRAFLECEIPLARIDVLKRLQQSVKLAASVRRSIMLSKRDKEPKKQEDEEPF